MAKLSAALVCAGIILAGSSFVGSGSAFADDVKAIYGQHTGFQWQGTKKAGGDNTDKKHGMRGDLAGGFAYDALSKTKDPKTNAKNR